MRLPEEDRLRLRGLNGTSSCVESWCGSCQRSSKGRLRSSKGRLRSCRGRWHSCSGRLRSYNPPRRRRQRSVRRLVHSDDYDFAAQWRVASEFVEESDATRGVLHEALDWEAMDATDLL